MNVSRSIQIKSDPQTVYRTFSDFGTWPDWSPWLLAEPQAEVNFSDRPDQVGGSYRWDGAVVGAGSMTHRQLNPPDAAGMASIQDELCFTRPWKSTSSVRFQLTPADAGQATDVRWEMNGKLPWFLFWMKSMMESLVGMDYDRGLRMAKALIETGSVDSETDVVGIEHLPHQRVVGLAAKTTLPNIGVSVSQTLTQTLKVFQEASLPCGGQWASVYHDLCLKTGRVSYTCGMIVSDTMETPSTLNQADLPGCEAMHVKHTGSYEFLGNAWFAAYQHLQAGKRKPNRKLSAWEVYEGDPAELAPEERITHVYIPVK
ncbi:SRPBCC family protein [Roseiconus nitratireducens]|nr:SRPBCC family protein [Roseiconus nitratireducens]